MNSANISLPLKLSYWSFVPQQRSILFVVEEKAAPWLVWCSPILALMSVLNLFLLGIAACCRLSPKPQASQNVAKLSDLLLTSSARVAEGDSCKMMTSLIARMVVEQLYRQGNDPCSMSAGRTYPNTGKSWQTALSWGERSHLTTKRGRLRLIWFYRKHARKRPALLWLEQARKRLEEGRNISWMRLKLD